MPLAGGTFTNVFNYTNVNNQLSGVITTSSLTMGNITIVAITTGGQTDNNKIPTKGYVDTLFSQYNPNLFVLVAGGTYNNIYSFENVLNRFGGLFTGKVITNDFTLDNKQMTSITTGGNTNNDKLTTQGYVDSMISQVGTQVTNNYYNKTYIDTELGDINTQLGNINTTIGGLATTAALTAGLALKADKSNTYTKTEIDNMFDGVVPVGDNVGKKYPNSYGGEIFNFYTVDDTTTPPTKNIASGNYSHAENYMTTASGSYSHVEGYISTASGTTSHAEGYMTKAAGSISHAEGQETKADGPNSHAEGSHTTAMGLDSHAGGLGTVADQSYMTAIGKYNEFNSSDLTVNAGKLFAIGNGSDENSRHDAFSVYSDGHITFNNNFQLYFGSIVFGWSNNASFTNIREVTMVGMAYKYMYGGHKYLCINVSGVPTWLTGSSTTDPLYLVYVRLSDTELYGNTFPLTGTNSGPGLFYVTNTTPLSYSLESDGTYNYSSKVVAHWNYTSYGTGFGAAAKFNFTNTLFTYYSDLS